MRKHIKQCSKDEVAFIHGFIRSHLDKLSGHPHFYDRMNERRFSFYDAVAALRDGNVVEVHDEKSPYIRALVRSRIGTCVVVDITTWTIITVYYNDPEDKHETLDWTPYRWSVNLVELVKSMLKKEKHVR